ncbi:hypothetical protein A6A04_14745 [Paramagnetospirillum marisnigri]|uniref:Cobalt ABC transporter permease n=1 Tax=Paramagnetospirillum marisnigri TaxID=1285242 RepID=A0A178MVQ2_9PROT|nr:hypothetical protein [Paramagnetospirillum marisnigri]OAN52973.1 hypothetical protein A6A04_14745 [Paramagnetospirillum marisnigri]
MIRPALLILGLLLAAAPAQAHKLKLFASSDGAVISGSVYFVGGAKAVGVPGVVQGPDGAELARFVTGEDGGFRVEARSRMDHLITVESGDGHAASLTIAAEDLPASLPQGAARRTVPPPGIAAPAELEAVEAAVARQIAPLRRQIDAYEERVRLHDLLGGIGTIFGLFGIMAWLSARRRSP